MKTFYIILFLISIHLLSCNTQNNEQDSQNTKDGKKELIKKKAEFNNKYTEIAIRDCDEVGEHEFTEDNTKYFDIHSSATNNHAFVFGTSVFCKYSVGSCGYNIQIFQEINGRYEIVFDYCARDFEKLTQTKNGYHLVKLTLRDGQEYTISYNGQEFEAYYSAIRGVPIEQASIIAKKSNGSIENFFHAIPKNYRYQKLRIGKTKTVDFYTTTMDSYFMFENNKPIFQEEDLMEFELLESNKEYFDIKVLRLENLVMTKDTSYFKPEIFVYSLKEHMYINHKTRQHSIE